MPFVLSLRLGGGYLQKNYSGYQQVRHKKLGFCCCFVLLQTGWWWEGPVLGGARVHVSLGHIHVHLLELRVPTDKCSSLWLSQDCQGQPLLVKSDHLWLRPGGDEGVRWELGESGDRHLQPSPDDLTVNPRTGTSSLWNGTCFHPTTVLSLDPTRVGGFYRSITRRSYNQRTGFWGTRQHMTF